MIFRIFVMFFKYIAMRLDELKVGQTAIIVKVLGHGAFRKRMIEMGFVKNRHIRVLLEAPLRDPIKYSLMDYEISLRRAEAHQVEVILVGVDTRMSSDSSEYAAILRNHIDRQLPSADQDLRTINVALVGNPNCGKTTMFNELCGTHEHVGNYSGVTVDAKYGSFIYNGYTINLVDLPGTYSLASYSPEELYVRRYLRDNNPDVIVNVVVASNLERNLYLTTELIDMDRKMVIALNMYDELQNSGDTLDYRLLGSMIGVPIVPTVSRTGIGIETLLNSIVEVYEDRDNTVRHIHVSLGSEIERGLTVVKDAIKSDPGVDRNFSPRYLAIKLLENDSEVEEMISQTARGKEILRLRDRELELIESRLSDDIAASIAGEKYGFIAGALAETMVKNDTPGSNAETTRVIDRLVTSPVLGFPIFLFIMFFIFWVTFSIGRYPMEWIDTGINYLGAWIQNSFPDGALKDLIADGIIGGVGGVIVFLPNILILYFCISFLEDSGYMARASFIMDRVMHRIGLHGKSFIPLLMGFGCTVPAIMSARSIESHTSRLITILINPFISCSARLPVYVLLVGTFFKPIAALVFFGIYLLGILVAVATARMLRHFVFKADVTPFVMELPLYRLPTWRNSLRHMWAKGEQYLRKMGGVIMIGAVIVWALNYFPLHPDAYQTQGIGIKANEELVDTARDSYLERMGKAINPVMQPLGFGWRATVSLIAGIPAKEIVVSTLGVLYTGNEDADTETLSQRLTADNQVTGKPDFTPAVALSFLVFVLLYCPCIATLTAIWRETGKVRYVAFSVIYNTVVAWLAAWIVYRLALLF